jgi:hypothetical protein
MSSIVPSRRASAPADPCRIQEQMAGTNDCTSEYFFSRGSLVKVSHTSLGSFQRHSPSCRAGSLLLVSTSRDARISTCRSGALPLKSSVVREHRGVERFRLEVPVNLSWQIRGEQDQLCGAFTRDVSSRGMFVFTRASMRLGRRLRFEINIMPSVSFPPLRVIGEGQVVRVERSALSAEMIGIAVVSRWFKVQELQSKV